jgi:hypothetical protein
MDDDITFGFGVRQKGMMKGKLELAADLTYTLATLGYNTMFNYNTTDLNGLNCSAPQYNSCGYLPNIVSEITQLKLTGVYTVDKSSKVMVRYTYAMLNASDYYYNGYQTGSTPNTMMPTNQQPGAYSINLVTVAYIYNF